MADKKEVLDRKTLDKYRKQIEDDFRNNYQDELVKELSTKVSKDVTSKFNKEYKDEIINSVTVEVKDEVKNQIIKEEKKLGRAKSFKIFRLSIYLLVLVAIIVYVAYRLYLTDNLEVIQYDYVKPETTKEVVKGDVTKEEEKVDYKKIYGYLLDDLKVYDLSLYKGTVKASDMKMINKIQMAYSMLKEDDVEQDGTIYTISDSKIKNAYNELFGTNDYESISFNIYNLSFVYSPNKNEYLAIMAVPNTEDIYNSVFDVTVDDNYINVKAYTGYVNNGKVRNITNNKELGNYDNVESFKDKLSVVTYKFTKDKNFYSLTVE
jgi:hypothetical protein